MRDVPGYEGRIFNELAHWRSDIRLVSRYDGGGSALTRWTNFDVVVARLATELSAAQWRAGAQRRAQYAKAKIEEFDLPHHVRFYWEIEAACA